jgi:hypothetical protein
MYQYAALLFMMEQPPQAETIEDDSLYGPLVKYYGLPIEAMMPLWNHTHYNEESFHNDIWFNVLRSKHCYTLEEKNKIISSAKMHCQLCYKWNRI